MSQLRSFLRQIKPILPPEPVVRFETVPGEQMQVDWVEFRRATDRSTPSVPRWATAGPVTLNSSPTCESRHPDRLPPESLHGLGGVPQHILYDNMKTVVPERDVDGPGEHRYHPGFLDYAKHCGFVIKLCRPYRVSPTHLPSPR